jgi:hypothetical protein
MLSDSRIFDQKNIIHVTKNELRKAEHITVFLVHWSEYRDQIDEILAMKVDSTALIIYAPQSEGRIEPQEVMENINSHRNTVVVNFRGRLMNDIFTCLITTGYVRN